jgi:hypothetical protein
MLKNPAWDKQEQQVTEEPWRKVLRDAAAIIDRGGHCKGSLFKGDAHCVDGAINLAAHGDWDYTPEGMRNRGLAAEASEAFCKFLGIGSIPFEWNDAPERTKDQVVASLRLASEA